MAFAASFWRSAAVVATAGSLACAPRAVSAEPAAPPRLPSAATCPVNGVAAASVKEAQAASSTAAGAFKRGLPEFSLAEVAKSDGKGATKRVLVTYRDGVYDITEFAAAHPGGASKIMLAAGGAVDPFWAMYKAPHAKEATCAQLETLRVGNVAEADRVKRREAAASAAASGHDPSDPYAREPTRSVALKPHTLKPFCSEAPHALIADSFLTSNEFFFVRHHLPVPVVDQDRHVVEIKDSRGGKATVRKFTVKELREKFPKHEVAATMQCSGNRRSDMNKTEKGATKGLPWGVGAISTAVWGGARLRDVLASIGVDVAEAREAGNDAHVRFVGLDADPSGEGYGGSVPAWRILSDDSDAVLAYEMNGEPLPRDHGAPLRAVCPGICGARSVKWLGAIEVAETESESFFQKDDYRVYPPGATMQTLKASAEWAVPVQDTPVQSAVTQPSADARINPADGSIEAKGYAFSGGGRGIVRVDVSADGGETWHQAALKHPDQKPGRKYAWTLWSLDVPLPALAKAKAEGGAPVETQLVVRAIDDAYAGQPASVEDIYNVRGLLCNAYHRVNVVLDADAE